MFFYPYFWYLKTAILDTWKSLKSPWILSFQFAMNPVPTCLSCPEKGHKTNLSHSVPSSNLPQWLSCHGDGVAIVILLSCVNNSCDGNWCLIALLLQFELTERKQSRCGLTRAYHYSIVWHLWHVSTRVVTVWHIQIIIMLKSFTTVVNTW